MPTLPRKRILVTGPAGQIAFPLVEELSRTTRSGASPASVIRRLASESTRRVAPLAWSISRRPIGQSCPIASTTCCISRSSSRSTPAMTTR